jgi:hypothetical protein
VRLLPLINLKYSTFFMKGNITALMKDDINATKRLQKRTA